MRKNTLTEVRELIKSLGRSDDLKVAYKKYGDLVDNHFYTITSIKTGLCYEVTMSVDSGFLNVQTFENSRLPFYEIDMILSLDKVLERMRNDD